ncbi:FIST C-terminal domain-containing protein [Azonexus sp.]|uniref:FIST C-terminal domain-containing protein n=1 Tax=Azonexus sp. TaxID=1872668 RepID=UPI002821FB4E|nr:FIST C-terminal domain-containing protein [Azonexus sp.]MDR1996115.1 FIST C-terminal domain-containing protein [Azonexus sp.]
MKAASGFASGRRPDKELAAEAVRKALAAAGLERAEQVLLLLSREFARQPTPAVLAAANAAGCLQIGGSTASGLLTEAGWLLDQPAAAALVLGELPPATANEAPLLSFSGHATLPYDWRVQPPRAGLLEANAATWSQARPGGAAGATIALPGLACQVLRADGLRPLEATLHVDQCAGYELHRVAGQPAADSLRRALPATLRATPPLHQIAVVVANDAPAVGILAANADGSLTLAAPLAAGQPIAWAMRQPLAAEQEMRALLATADGPAPAFALLFSCIGRGPLFYGGDDRDLLAFRERYPGVPLLGAYGSGQIAPTPNGNRLFQNTALTLLYRSHHV